jgi:Ser/Thr protein kinase RdoA (MazF antagonist)
MLLARGQNLDFVPSVYLTQIRQTLVEHSGRLWDLTTWLPGSAAFRDCPSHERLRAACTALARLHQSWDCRAAGHGPCPAVQRRLEAMHRWRGLIQSGWRPDWSLHPPTLSAWARRAWDVLSRLLPASTGQLLTWTKSPLPLTPCLCDIWHDHVLFQENTVTGIIDYGSVKIDHVAVDLARLLGSLIGDVEEEWQIGLSAYRKIRPFRDNEERLARFLDRSGTLVGLTNWLLWLFHDGRRFDNPTKVAQRLGQMVDRVERWQVRSLW